MEKKGQTKIVPATISVLALLAVILFVLVKGPWVIMSWKFHKFDTFEEWARKVVTGSELQAWATNLLAKQPANTNRNWARTELKVEELGANFPKQLLELFRGIPLHFILEEGGDDYPGWITVDWGGGMMGHTGFDIGPTNFTDEPRHRGHPWQPGVYFWKAPE